MIPLLLQPCLAFCLDVLERKLERYKELLILEFDAIETS